MSGLLSIFNFNSIWKRLKDVLLKVDVKFNFVITISDIELFVEI